MKTILVTAFEPFGERAVNASAEVLARLPERIGGCPVTRLLLPVVFGKAARKALSCPADWVFLLGEAGGRETVTPEEKAVNRRDARIPDNEGRQPREEPVCPEGPAEYRTAVPVSKIVSRMRAEGEAVAVSSDAGAYVCNDTYYLTGVGSRVPVVFIHVPAVPEKAAAYAGTVRRFIELAASQP